MVNQGSAKGRWGLLEKPWNEYINKTFEMRRLFQIPPKISREFLSGDWQYL